MTEMPGALGGRRVADAAGRAFDFLLRALRAAALLAATLLGLLLVTFLIGRVVPIDPVLAAFGDRLSASAYERARIALGLDRPLLVQFLLYVWHVAHGDLGRSLFTANAVRDDLAHVFPATLELATLATLLGVGLGVPLGVYGASHRGGWGDRLVRVFGTIGYTTPIFWLALLGLLFFYARLGWVAGPGEVDFGDEDIVTPVSGLLLVDSALAGQWGIWLSALRHLVLPVILLGYFSLAYVSRMTRSFVIAQLGQEYILVARAKGLPERRVVWRHAVRNALLPLATVAALSYANLLEGSVLTETVFSWPGIGAYLTDALLAADMNAVLGATIVVGAAFIGLNFVAELLQRQLDPRLR